MGRQRSEPCAICRSGNRVLRGIVITLSLCALTGGLMETAAQKLRLRETLAFAAEMARKGNWREARYRWRLAAEAQPGNPRILNNLAVAAEIVGETEEAQSLYNRALELSGGDPRIRENSRRFERAMELSGIGAEDGKPQDGDRAGDPVAAPLTAKNAKRSVLRLTARFSVPARLDLSKYKTLLVASFLTDASEELDTNRELTRFLRSEFHKKTSLEVRDVTPPPAIPEQTVDDLVANAAFWRHLGQEYDADLVVSGVVRYTQSDSSGFQEIDVVSPVTGQKVRRTRFVEQEKFTYAMDLFFIDGVTGELLFRDRLERSAVYPGGANDPLTAFYGIVESMAKDVLAVVSPRIREDIRLVFES